MHQQERASIQKLNQVSCNSPLLDGRIDVETLCEAIALNTLCHSDSVTCFFSPSQYRLDVQFGRSGFFAFLP